MEEQVGLDTKGEQLFQEALLKSAQLKESATAEEKAVKGSVKGGLWNSQVDDYARAAKLPNYAPACPVDRLTFGDKFPQCRIVNYSRAEEEGTHWVAIYLPHSSVCVYVDSYGLPPDAINFRPGGDTPLRRAISTVTCRVIYQQETLQHPSTAVCGYYCIYFLQKLSKRLGPGSTSGLIFAYLKRLRKETYHGLSAIQRDYVTVRWVNSTLGKAKEGIPAGGERNSRSMQKNIKYIKNIPFVGIRA